MQAHHGQPSHSKRVLSCCVQRHLSHLTQSDVPRLSSGTGGLGRVLVKCRGSFAAACLRCIHDSVPNQAGGARVACKVRPRVCAVHVPRSTVAVDAVRTLHCPVIQLRSWLRVLASTAALLGVTGCAPSVSKEEAANIAREAMPILVAMCPGGGVVSADQWPPSLRALDPDEVRVTSVGLYAQTSSLFAP